MRLRIGLGSLWATMAVVGWSQQYTISTIAGGAPPPTPAVAVNVAVGPVSNTAIDAAGNLYFSSALHCVFKLDASGTLTRVAGICRAGYAGDGGSATNAQLRNPAGLAVDAAGNLYIADNGNHRLRKVTPSGLIMTVAGTGVLGYSGDGGPATNAQLGEPWGVAVDHAGNVYFSDAANSRIRKITPGGMITVIAGSDYGYLGDGGPATSARLNNPHGLAFDAAGSLYVADTGHYRIRKITLDGLITTVAGSGYYGYSGDGGLAINAGLGSPSSVAVDGAGTLYVTASARTRKVLPNGVIIPVAGDGVYDYWGNSGPATRVSLSGTLSVSVDPAGNLYIADAGNYRVHKVTPGGLITTVAGNGNRFNLGDGGPATSAQLGGPLGLALDTAGNLYIADSNRIRKATPGGTITTIAGDGNFRYGGEGPAISAQLDYPVGLSTDAAGNLYIADLFGNCIRKISPSGFIATFAGAAGYSGDSGDGGSAAYALLSSPAGVTADSAGNLYIADSGNNRIRKVSPDRMITTVTGVGGYPGATGDGGPATSAKLYDPQSIAIDGSGNLYIADRGNERVRKVSPSGIITTVAGNGVQGYTGDGGVATSAQLLQPGGVAVDAAGNLYIADTLNHRIRKVSSNGRITTIAGNGGEGYSGDGGPATNAELGHPAAIAVDGAGRIYVATYTGPAVRVLQPIAILARTDFNGDSKPDMLWQNDATRQVSVWYMGGAQGNTRVTDAWLAANGPQGWRVVGTADFNGDGKLDLVWQNDITRQVAVWYLGGPQGNDFLGDSWLAANGPVGWRVAGIADLNGDGKSDLVWQHDTTRQVSVWYLSGAQGTTFLGDAWLAPNGATSWRVVGLADFNGDGKLDLVWQHDSTRQVIVWYLAGTQGNTYLSDAWLAANGAPGWRVAGLADCNSDGKPDLLWQQDSTRQVVVWYLGGTQGNTFLSDAWLAQNGPQGWTLIAQ